MTDREEPQHKMNGVIILGSARRDGHTRKMVETLASQTGMRVVDLNDFDIGYFEYDNYDRGDDFLELIESLMDHHLLVFATPVYWYNMSAIMKNFFDRITDLLRVHKETGRKFRSKSMALLSCSATPGPDPDFARPFRKTAEYLGMDFLGHLATWTFSEDDIPEEVESSITSFALELRQSTRNP